MKSKKLPVFASLLAGLLLFPHDIAVAADSNAVSRVFSQLATAPTLADPSIIVVDEKTGEVIFQSNANSPRKPASVIKLVSAVAAYTHLSPSDSFTTSLWQGIETGTIVIQGALDPWISYKHSEAVKMGRTSWPRIENKILSLLQSEPKADEALPVIYYSNLYSPEVNHLKAFLLDRGIKVTFKKVTPNQSSARSGKYLLASTSPTVQEIVDWTLVWSDNLLAERIARLASRAAGNSFDDKGVAKTFRALLSNLGIDITNLVVKDASGLSKENRMTARQVSQLLMIIYHNPQFAPLIEGLPIGGISGTLQERFIETAPTAIGLVRAKTGTLNGTTNLAGFVESGDHQYIFVVIADRHSKSYTVTKRVRATVDRILGKIANPLLPVLLPINDSSESVTASS